MLCVVVVCNYAAILEVSCLNRDVKILEFVFVSKVKLAMDQINHAKLKKYEMCIK